jgi:hypothetical protein
MQQQQAYYQQQGMNPFPHMGMMMTPNGQYNQNGGAEGSVPGYPQDASQGINL